jgi:sugar lactone lactonase YvrE
VSKALTIKTDDGPNRPSARDLLEMPFFKPHFRQLDVEMLREEIKLAREGPWAFLINVSGVSEKFEEKNAKNHVLICRSNGLDKAAAENLRAQLVAKISAMPENKNFEEDYEIKEIVVADVLRRALAFLSTAHDFNTKYDGLGLFGTEKMDGFQPFKMSWATDEEAGGTESERKQRQAVWDRFEKFKTMAQKQFPNVRVLLAFQLSTKAACEGILNGNFADLSILDPGYFGRAIYLTTSVEYATHFYGTLFGRALNLIICAVVIGNSYPVIECPFTTGGEKNKGGLLGSPIRAKSDSHIVIVGSNPVSNQHLGDHYCDKPLPVAPEKWDHCRTYTEIAVKSESQILPLGYVELEMTKEKKEEMEDAPAESMGKLGKFELERGNSEEAERYFDKAVKLSTGRKKHGHLRARAKLHSHEGRTDKAIADLEEAVGLKPEWVEGQVELAAAYAKMKRWAQALQIYTRIVKVDPSKTSEYFGCITTIAQQLALSNEAMQLPVAKLHTGTDFAGVWADPRGEGDRILVAGCCNHKVEELTGLPERPFKADSAKGGATVVAGRTELGNYAMAMTEDTQGNQYMCGVTSCNIMRRDAATKKIELFAGSGTKGMKDGNSKEAQFSDSIYGLAWDPAGVLYVADTNNNAIRAIDADNVTTLLEGQPGIHGLTFVDGKVIFVDGAKHVIRQVDVKTKECVILAGKEGEAGGRDGQGSEARFYHPSDVCADIKGNLYVVDKGKGPATSKLRRIERVDSSEATVMSVALGQFNRPCGVACDGCGNVYVADRHGKSVLAITMPSEIAFKTAVDSGHILALIKHRKIKKYVRPRKPKKGQRVYVGGGECKVGTVELVGGGGYWNRCKIIYDDGSRNKEYDRGYRNDPYVAARGGWLIWQGASGCPGPIDVYPLPDRWKH